MRKLAQAVTVILLLGYPLAVYLGLNYLPGNLLAPLLALLLLLRLLTQQQQLKALALPIFFGLLLAISSFVAKQQHWLLYYPVVMNLCMLGLFGGSLLQGPSMVERLASITEPQLPDAARPYLRKVTWLWCLLFVINGAMATYTALYTSLATWTLYNGFIAYLLIGLLAGSEWLYRHFWLTRS
ncbi:hypothetical protein [Shewanella dokdonensis]|uniref:DNA gyrase subunit B n=1 Tax=Shewanella dokdonensis TaxID=712036 RepID=A0ABX8DJ43_9GAMM|nr:hypothetical protein [Shewanella dokdonensis]MCL1075755.1 hypothetical protein [Shewanella dokdonensis]QVK24818.1 hypothetical protein KHX94_10195 [Shewanella dokdonensis]